MAPSGMLLRAATSRRLAANTKSKASLSTKQCLAIVNKLGNAYLSGQPHKVQELVKRLREGLLAQGMRHLEPETATAILWKALREINAGLQKCAEEAQATLDGADAEREARVAVAAVAEAKLVELRQAMVQLSRAVRDALKMTECRKIVIAAKRSTRQSQEAQVKKIQGRKRQLEEVERDSYEPLRRGPADGQEGQKHLAVLRRTGKAYGFQKELLSIAPVILRKQLDARHTFDGLVVDQLDNEFFKHFSALEASAKDCERAIMEHTEEVRQAEEELMGRRAAHKKAAMELSAAAASVQMGRQALVEAKACVRRLPADLRRAEHCSAKMEARLLSFQRGPRATFEKALGLEFGAVASIEEAHGNGVGNVSEENIMTIK